MANISEYSIVTYERQPGHWRAAITRKMPSRNGFDGAKVFSIVTPDDFASASNAQLAAEKLIKELPPKS